MTTIIFDKDKVENRLRIIENKLAELQGAKPLWIGFCMFCGGTGRKQTMISGRDYDEEPICNQCQGKGK